MTKVSLALGSGGARGYAHIGAIQVLEERGLEVVAVAGSSMGALVGGVYAAGELAAYTEWAVGLNQLDVLRLLDLSLSAPGAIRAERVLSRVRELLAGRRIEDLPIPFTAVATDLLARREVWFQRGPVDEAISASIAIPGIFPPVLLNGRMLVDGGLMDPVPVAPTAAVPADLTIAISLGGERSAGGAGPAGAAVVSGSAAETAEPRPIDEWAERFRRGAAQALDTDMAKSLLARFPAAAEEAAARVTVPAAAAAAAAPAPPGLTKLDVMNQALEAMQDVVTRYRLAGSPPDLLVTIPKDACRTLDFHRAAPMIEIGRRRMGEALDEAGFSADRPG
ncbi:patatin-like phospholipase family protein [Paraconexibacter antarcticus]|uniref:Patatin-like phospholipase family protein n=1 Tax=Paraconexibacter antarcticus TaxID=2949664 RepID=A0ABY5DQZ0_9ACTN|nr:patatin-like phospholipase family protein [Paraconexibacter antarcticus]UTI63658.1 patatin-like phospholipase family protein [Paraconexibacter antarcticus]